MNQPLLKIAYVVEGSAGNVHAWSGLVCFIAESLKKQNAELSYIEIPKITARNKFEIVFDKIYGKLIKLITGKKYKNNRTVKLAKKYAREIRRKLPEDVNIIFIPSGTVFMSFLKSNKKKVIYNDATFAAMVDYYPDYVNLCTRTRNVGNKIEKNAFENSDLCFFSSDWAAQSAINDYNISPQKVKVIPFGANVKKEFTDAEIMDIINNRCTDSESTCRLLFIGVDWERKGGSIALETAVELKRRGLDVHLDIIGIKNLSLSLPDFVTNHGYISKNNADGIKKIDELYKNASFFILPTRQECFGVVFSESSSYGLPSLSTKTGGVETAIKNNINGFTFNLSDSHILYADCIEKFFNNKAEYKKLCFSAWNEYRERLNWNASGRKMVKYIKEIL